MYDNKNPGYYDSCIVTAGFAPYPMVTAEQLRPIISEMIDKAESHIMSRFRYALEVLEVRLESQHGQSHQEGIRAATKTA
ncbi:MAG: hypothetical protein WDO18_01975 [Acidobacteriota bacterium]